MTVPTSTKPKPILYSPSTASPCLSKPAASPSGLRNRRPRTCTSCGEAPLRQQQQQPRPFLLHAMPPRYPHRLPPGATPRAPPGPSADGQGSAASSRYRTLLRLSPPLPPGRRAVPARGCRDGRAAEARGRRRAGLSRGRPRG